MVLKLYGSAMSTARVLVVILELRLPYEYIPVDIAKGDQNDEAYRKLQPFGKVPVLDDDGFVMFESRAICKYLVRKYQASTRLMPNMDDVQAYARFEQACSIEQSYFAAACELIGTESVIRPKKGLGPPDVARIAQASEDFEKTLAIYDGILGRQPYLAGEELSLADLFHLPNGAAMKTFGYREVLQKYSNVDRWFAALQARETWTRAASIAGTVA